MEPDWPAVVSDMVEQIAALLRGYEPADEVEAGHHARMLELIDTPRPTSRHQFAPGHFTASAFVLNDRGELLLIHHAKLHRWLQPGGHIDPTDQTPAAAAQRELQEEAAVTDAAGNGQLIDVDVHPIPANPKKNEPAHEHFDLRFLFRTGSHDILAGSDALDAKWLKLDRVAQEITDASVIRCVAKLERR